MILPFISIDGIIQNLFVGVWFRIVEEGTVEAIQIALW